ncbi:response regulator transcription factor [Kitasatospora cineracea]
MTTAAPTVASRNLTDQERRVLRHVAAGGTNPAIARKLGSTPAAVQSALVCIYRKLGARNRAHAVAIAAHNGWITLDHVTPAKEP